jgi:bifunctional UDP-N-acetylglucosamine pyrophosphorylase / glucosamine-1-phosphate N-acetyltransferase
MARIHALIAAAGRGSRAGLPFPKTLFPIQGKPILVRIMELLQPFDSCPTVIVSPEGNIAIRNCLSENGYSAYQVVQPEPKGMGDAVLCFKQSPVFSDAEHILLVWGDIPFIQPETVSEMVNLHLEHANDFTFVTRQVESAYTIVSRNDAGVVTGVVETRELGISTPQAGERDIGLFIFRKNAVFNALSENSPHRFGKSTGEHSFLYIISLLVKNGMKVEALKIGTELDLISLNSLEDIDGFL